MRAWSDGFLGSLSRCSNRRLKSAGILVGGTRRIWTTCCPETRPQPALQNRRNAAYERCYTSEVNAGFAAVQDGAPPQPLMTTAHKSLSGPRDNPNDPEQWASMLDEYLPEHLRREHFSGKISVLSPKDAALAIARLSLQARLRGNVELLAHLGLVQGRWEVLLWITDQLVSSVEDSTEKMPRKNGLSTIHWPIARRLDDFTAKSFLHEARTPNSGIHAQSLRSFTNQSAQSGQATRSQLLGQIWATIGNLLLAAAEKDTEASNTIMSKALLMVASLHHRGHVPAEVYQAPPDEDTSALRQPPLLHHLSTRMLSSLSDTVYRTQVNEGKDSTAVAREVMKNTGVPGLGPELWFEFVLWCCLHQGLLMEGSQLVGKMRKYTGLKRWTLICWRDIMENPDVKWEEFSQLRLSNSPQNGTTKAKTSKKLSRRSVVERTISSEVVAAYVEALVDKITSSTTPITGTYSATLVLDAVFVLKSVLQRDRMSLGVSTWEAIIARFATLPELVIERTPRLMETALKLAESSGEEALSVNAPMNVIESHAGSSYIFDGSAAVIGFYHRVLLAYIRSRDAAGAVRVLKQLQALTDANKRRSLEHFFEELREANDAMTSGERVSKSTQFAKNSLFDAEGKPTFDFQARFPGVQYPGLDHQVPNYVMAELLDLITENEAYNIGHWLLSSEDIDGPWISPNQYANPLLVPSLIRFAAATGDTKLLSTIMRLQTASISGKTLVALCEVRVTKADWKGAYRIFALIRDHALHSWNSYDMATIIRSLVLHIRTPSEGKLPETSASAQASKMLQRLLRGDLGQVWGMEFSSLDTIVGMLCSIHSGFSNLFSNLLARGGHYTADLKGRTFHVILDGVVKAYGSEAGIRLVEDWCSPNKPHREVDVPEADVDDGVHGPRSASEAFGVEVPVRNTQLASFSGVIPLRTPAVRIIVRQALNEDRGRAALTVDHQDSEFTSKRLIQRHLALDWAAGHLRTLDSMTDENIDYELQGYLSAVEVPTNANSMLSYHHRTLTIYRAFLGPRRQWARENEALMREFAGSAKQRQLEFPAAPPAERYFLHCLAEDFGMVSESFGEASERKVTVFKKTKEEPVVPARTVGELLSLTKNGVDAGEEGM